MPLVVTSYNMHEAFEDEDTFLEWGVPRRAWCWRPELNPFRCLEKRRGNATCNNCYWQCVWDDPGMAADTEASRSATAGTDPEVPIAATGEASAAEKAAQKVEEALQTARQQQHFPILRALLPVQQRTQQLADQVAAKVRVGCSTSVEEKRGGVANICALFVTSLHMC